MAVALMALAIITALAVVAATQLVTARARAATAADAGALAAAVHSFPPAAGGVGPRRAAASLVLANGARLERCLCPVVSGVSARTVEVEASVEARVILIGTVRVAAASRAEYLP